MKRTAFFISDGTGITAETLGQSLLAQFENIQFSKLLRPYVDTVEKARDMVQQINAAAEKDAARPIIFDTVVNDEIRRELAKSQGYMIDIFSTFLAPLEQELGDGSSYSVGKTHSIQHNTHYKDRIDAVHYAMDNDDGARTHHYAQADIILVGVSRCGKTPSCLYMALQYGIRAANYPLTEDDMERLQLPKALKEHKHKLFGLTIDPDRLQGIRNERRPNSRYSSFAQCEFEVREVENLFRKENIPYINSTHFSVEEISAKILMQMGIERRLK
ncbi:MAG TPA: kinase/pyrophosphorylase [Pseudomonas sp.]|jgi:regulator of PEP synthase PpsR (kinase-PPPase family)|uniref:Putative phosphoenolpyruvate synthase regulatory protein n=1 Tax=Halopseudomonas pachastrellae TaxID=254161 RepID=A0A1S8DJF3_9GAMM|nr:pyruvate, water dikinase regulatory protein [Halopseudomonas pachastrellae]MAB41454.1 kinase/pyrophosphorylase [Pseudomonadales bacterium]MAP29155.1 kinase/pyrophosphorylase [Pseudomonas sp.]MED5493096.1 pyruvate, water dikinase regulatory protein [Pseudomonadota bacterium]MAG66796.1 kinase/pyrophosphorylase [Pseudomonadales bacterium]MAQ52784.1 kinase/pyrophosphorylase [Pseudomonas sp.]|tara:strand:+ start:1060 stop:1878 length:819 start_codon:yes stop_codon:yes gene_type:complete